MSNVSITRWISLGAVVILFFFVDLMAPLTVYLTEPGPDDWVQTLVFCLIGTIMGQVAVLAVWAAYAPQRLIARLVGSLLAALLIWCAIQLGANAGYAIATSYLHDARYVEGMNATGAAIVGGMILMGFFTMQGAMWLLRLIFGWRLSDGLDDSERNETRFGLLQLMIWTAAIGIVLAVCRMVLPGAGWNRIDIEWQTVVICSITSLYPVIIAVPAVWACLRKKGNVALRLLALGVFTLVAAIVEVCLLILVMSIASWGAPPPDVWTTFIPFGLSINFGQAAALVCTLLVVRLWGYRLAGRKRWENASTAVV